MVPVEPTKHPEPMNPTKPTNPTKHANPTKQCQAPGLLLFREGRFNRSRPLSFDRPRISSPRAAGTYLLPKDQGWTEERFGMLALNAKGDLIADRILAHGTATVCLISPREFSREALRFGTTSALAWHNHPSPS